MPVNKLPVLGTGTDTELMELTTFVLGRMFDVPGVGTETKLTDVAVTRVFKLERLVAIVGKTPEVDKELMDGVERLKRVLMLVAIVGKTPEVDKELMDGVERLKRVLILVAVAERELPCPRLVPVGRLPIPGTDTETELI